MEHEATVQHTTSSLHMSDVIEVLQKTEPDFGQHQDTDMFNASISMSDKNQACVKITEQPASKALRFRYECEGRSAGSIPGASSTPENKTFPAIQVVGYQGRAVVVVSCVTKDAPYRPHPHNLVGKEGCKKGVCTVEISGEAMTATFSNLGIQCVKKKDIDEALRIREGIRVDPFHTGFAHRSQPTSIDLNAVRLCFQVFLEGSEKGKFTFSLPAVVSDPIYDKKAMCDLVICKLSDCSASVAGGREIILLCEKVAKEDIQIRFFTEEDSRVTWEGFADFTPASVHKQVAISFRTPRYKAHNIDRPVNGFIQLKRPSDGATSEALPFTFTPLDLDPIRKRPKTLSVPTAAPEISQPSIGHLPYPDVTQASGLLLIKTEHVTESASMGVSYQGYKNVSPKYSPQHPHFARDGRTPSPRPAPQPWTSVASVRHGHPTLQLSQQPLQPPLQQSSLQPSLQRILQPSQQQQQQLVAHQKQPPPPPPPQQQHLLSHHNTPSSTPEFLPQQYPEWSMSMGTPSNSHLNVIQPPTSHEPSNALQPLLNPNMVGILPTVPPDHGSGSMIFHPLRLVDNFPDIDRRPPSQIPANTTLPEAGVNSNLIELDSILFTESMVQNLTLSSEDPHLESHDSLSRYLGSTAAQSVSDLNNILNN